MAQGTLECRPKRFARKVKFTAERSELLTQSLATGDVPGTRAGIVRKLGASIGPGKIALQVETQLGIGRICDEAALHGSVNHLPRGAEIVPDLVNFRDNECHESQIRIIVGDEMRHSDVPGLPVTVNAAVTLLQARRIPRNIIVMEITGCALEIEPLGCSIGRNKYSGGRSRIVEGSFDGLTLAFIHVT
jgi:hypothetical protein